MTASDFDILRSTSNIYPYAVKISGVNLPSGQKTHMLRHTFASPYMMNGGNILTLQRVLGHASLNMTMRYAHLAPDHLLYVLMLGPIRGFRHLLDTGEDHEC